MFHELAALRRVMLFRHHSSRKMAVEGNALPV
jgi:hypothetical protein